MTNTTNNTNNKYRVHELAKEFTTSSKVILDILARNNMPAKNHMASIEEEAYQILVRTFALKPDTAEEIRERQRKKAAMSAPLPPVKPEPAKAPPPPPKIFYGGGQQRPQQSRPRLDHSTIPPRQQQPASPAQPQALRTPAPTVPRMPQPVAAAKPRPVSPVEYKPTAEVKSPLVAQTQTPGKSTEIKQQSIGEKSAARPQPTISTSTQRNSDQPVRNASVQNSSQQGQQRPIFQQRPAVARPQANASAGSSPRPVQGQAPGQATQAPRRDFTHQSGPARSGQGPQQRPQGLRPPVSGAAASNGTAPTRPSQPIRSDRRPVGGSDRPQQSQGRPQNTKPPFTSQGGRQGSQGKGRNTAPVISPAPKQEPVRPKTIRVGESLSVKELASKMSREVNEVIKKLMMLGVMATINQEIDFDTASLIAGEFGVTVEELPPEIDPTVIPEIEDDPSTLVHRPPVVTVMGHVDHGKTSLLDAIRQTHVTSQEAGGITQHIGAYQVVQQGKKIVFLDTPGHEAFTSMRARGAQVTDIAILVVAADDGVMPQTIEAINHAKAAKVPIIVAINKMDKPDANPERVQQQLTEYGLVAEAWGGDTIMAPVSAFKKTGISDLLEMILLVAEVQDLKANPNRPAIGTIVEAELDKGKGPVATVLVQNGTLRIGDSIIAGTAFGKVRAMTNDRGEKVKKASPATPVEVIGLSDVPQAGDILAVVDERTARNIAEKRLAKNKADAVAQSQKVTLEDLFQQIKDGSVKDLNLVVKADVQGSIEALRQSLESMKNKEVRVIIVHSGVGAINESDVMLASASNALIIGFNVRPDANARKFAETEKVDMRMYRVIYDAINDVEAAMTGMLAPEFREVVLGRVEVRQVFNIPKGVVAGSYVQEGKITSTSQVRILRNGIVVHEGKLESLRRFKDDVREVAAGYECGITLERYRDVKEGDIIEAFIMEQIPR